MCHYRDKIESCVKDILWDQTIARQRVFTVSEAVYNQNYPMIILFSSKETVEKPPLPMRPFRRLSLDIVGIIKGHKDLMTQSHLFAKQIEEAIAQEIEMFPTYVQQVDLAFSEVEVQGESFADCNTGKIGLGAGASSNPHSPALQGYIKLGYTIEYRAGTTTFNIGSHQFVADESSPDSK